jgi:hypothetical protein
MLWISSATLGFGYGGMFGLFPTLMIEWFGLGMYLHSFGIHPSDINYNPYSPFLSELGIPLHFTCDCGQSI